MSDEGEKTCPLCAEEMDLTDQQLKPCNCGYEICVWCWHHIMDMAEKDNVEGRCPACRTPYNKEKIVDKAAQCERLVSSVEKKVKSKSKGKTPDGRKNLSNVRVIQRNLVYISGLPLNLADEDLLQREEYFPRYGKVQKVSISRTAAGTIQQFPNNTCSVYITYSKEEEAVRCIQSVHGYILEGRPLRACFGTTKYCHAWLRNMQCTNPDCLYLHEIGTHEDSFVKDEIISAGTRNRVEQITGGTVDMQRRSGNVLPWPADEVCNNSSSSSGVTNSKSSTNNVDICSDSILESSVWQTPASSVRGSPPNSSCSKSVVLPATASWGMRASNRQQSPTSVTSSDGPSKQKSDACGISVAYLTATASLSKVSVLHSDSGKKLNGEIRLTAQMNKSEPVASVELYSDADQQRKPSNTSAMIGHSINQVISSQISTPPLKVDGSMSMPADIVKSVDSRGQSCVINPERDSHVRVESKVQELCSDKLSLKIETQGLQHRDTDYREFSQSHTPTKAASTSKDTIAPRDRSEFRLESQLHVVETDSSEVKNDLLSSDIQSFWNPESVSCTDNQPNLSQILDGSRAFYLQDAYNSPNVNVDSQPNKFSAQEYNIPVLSNGYSEDRARSLTDLNSSDKNSSYAAPNESRTMSLGRYGGELVNCESFSDNDMGESRIISNILSMNFDSWDDSLASPQNLAKLLGETDKHHGSLGVSSSRKVQNNNQSRFSFAREEDQTFNYDPSFTGFDQTPRIQSFTNGFKDNGNFNASEISNGLYTLGGQQPGNFASIHSHNSLNRISVSRAPVSAPPGFSGPNRAPPPGFTNYDRVDQTFDMNSGKNFLDNSSFMGNTNQSLSTMHFDSTNADIEFLDPAILAVGKGRFPGGLSDPGLDMRSSYPTQMSNYENESRLQLMMQKSSSSRQNSRYLDMGDNFSSHPDNYGMPTWISERDLANNGSQSSQFALPQSRNQPISNGSWDGWSEVKGGNDSRMTEYLRSERLGINKYFTGYEDSKYRMPNSGDLYNQTYGI
ncbi:RNA recognition motif-containing protein [Heracleum sosnowskyi]|uniref:RNA recognition motif-containing protein n=1 Tax=Heracleum sosnowskyi TaxID=360622 RepID=A0AAD8MI38_9APIA|nr:RNA recognition motif-containing protein [Heracleum sosnowskyi]